MIWIAGALLVMGVLVAVLSPLVMRGTTPSAKKAIQEQKLLVADELAKLAKTKEAGDIGEEEFGAQQRSLETEAVSLMQAEAQADNVEDNDSRERRTARAMVGALLLVFAANVTGGLYLYLGGWELLTGAGAGAQAAMHPDTGGGQAAAPDANEMIQRLENRLQENPSDPAGQALLGRSYVFMERFADAVAAYKKAIALEPENHDHKLGLAMAAIRGGDTQSAMGAVDDILAADGSSTQALWYKGMLQAHENDMKGAEKTWAKLISLVPPEEKDQVKAQIEQIKAQVQQ